MWLLIDSSIRTYASSKLLPGIKFSEKFLLFDDPELALEETYKRGWDDSFTEVLGCLQDPGTMIPGSCQMYKCYPVDLELYRLEIRK
jgi:hypothetical protein